MVASPPFGSSVLKIQKIQRGLMLLAAAAILPMLAACATKPTDPDDLAAYNEANDPLEPTNRVIYKFNDGLETYVLRPVVVGYRAVAPKTYVRDPIHRFLLNLDSPVIFANDVLQGKPRRASATFWRFIVNSTAGLGGLIDVAGYAGVPYHDADFGETLALWGAPEGPFLELPLYGPSNPRDGIGVGADIALDPLTWVHNGHGVNAARWSRYGATAIDEYDRNMDNLDAVKKTSLDPYATIRSLYRQNREATIAQLKSSDSITSP